MTAFGNARLDNRYRIEPDDLPRAGSNKARIGFLQ
jgi:ATP-dependent Lon protease